MISILSGQTTMLFHPQEDMSYRIREIASAISKT